MCCPKHHSTKGHCNALTCCVSPYIHRGEWVSACVVYLAILSVRVLSGTYIAISTLLRIEENGEHSQRICGHVGLYINVVSQIMGVAPFTRVSQLQHRHTFLQYLDVCVSLQPHNHVLAVKWHTCHLRPWYIIYYICRANNERKRLLY